MSERIYIQTCMDPGEPVDGLTDEMTWCGERVYGSDIEYVRADIHAAAQRRIERLEAALAWYADKQNWWSSDYGDDGIWQDTWRPDKDGKRPEHGFERARAALDVQP